MQPNATNVATCALRIATCAKAKAGGMTSAARAARRSPARGESGGSRRWARMRSHALRAHRRAVFIVFSTLSPLPSSPRCMAQQDTTGASDNLM
jgi:hypothetical protein